MTNNWHWCKDHNNRVLQ